MLVALAALAFMALPLQAQLVVDGDITAEQLVETLVGTGVSFENVEFNCPDGAFGSFDGTTSDLGMDGGIVLTSGSVDECVGPNDDGGAGVDNGAPGDSDLDDEVIVTTFDACVLEFDFTPLSANLSFNYVFGSEEYLEFVDGGYNDVFAFYIEGPGVPFQNIALIPGTTTPVSIDNVNDLDFPEYYVDNGPGFPADPTTTVQYDGFTTVLAAEIEATPCEQYHIKLAIADAGDGILDSGVFLEAGSFSTDFVEVTAEAVTTTFDEYDTAIEGCVDAVVNFNSETPLLEDLFFDMSYGGSVTAEDFTGAPDSFTMPAGTTDTSFIISFIDDGILEGLDSLVVSYTLDLGCDTLSTFDAVVYINDITPLTASVSPAEIEPGMFVTFGAEGGSGTYYWEPEFGLSDPNVANPTANPLETTTYTVYSQVGECLLSQEVTVVVNSCDQPDAGTIAADYCNAGSVTATAVDFVFGDELDVIGYALHNSPEGDVTIDGFELYGFNSTGTFTVDGSFPLNTELYISSIISDDDGTGLPNLADDCIDISVGTPVFITDVPADAGVVNLSGEVLCAEDVLTATAPGSSNPSGFVFVYLLHNSPDSDPSMDGFEIYGINETGIFPNDGSYPTNQEMFVTTISALDDGTGAPDLSAPCGDISAASPVVFLTPLEIITNEYCDWEIGEYHIVFSFAGGLPEYDDDAVYTVGGDVFGEFSLGQSEEIIIAEGVTNLWSTSVIDDGNGCTAEAGDDFICIKTPIELIDFSGEVKAEGDLLSWSTASEDNNSHFTLFHSIDGVNFEQIAIVESQGDSQFEQAYSFLHTSPVLGVNYYQLSQTDFNGETTNFGTIALTRDEVSTSLVIESISPIPTSDALFVALNAPQAENASLNVYDVSGRLIAQQSVALTAGTQNISLDVSTYPAGIYMLSLQTTEATISSKFVKK